MFNFYCLFHYICSIHPEGGFYKPKQLTFYHTKVQFSLWSLILVDAQKLYEAESKGGGDMNAKYKDYMESVFISLEKWLSNLHKIALSEVSLHDGPQKMVYSHLPLFASGSVTLVSITCFAPTTTLWDSNFSFISIKNHVVSIADYKKHFVTHLHFSWNIFMYVQSS